MSEGTRTLHWYAAYTKINQELTIKKRLDHLEIENYLPMRDEVRETSSGRKNVRVILIPHLIFIRTDQTTAFSLLNEHGLNVVYLKDLETRHLLIVPDKQMRRKHSNALHEIESLKAELLNLGVTPDNTYMFIQGHHILDNVVMRLLIPVCTVLRREREQQIHDLALHNIQLQNELTNYQRSQVAVEVVIHKNLYYKNSPLYKKIQRDVERFLKIIK